VLRKAFFDDSKTASELLARGAPPPRRWLIEDLLPAGEVGLLIGAGGAGKGHLLQLLALMLSSGPEFAGFHVPAPVKTLFVSLEDGMDELHRRLDAAVRERDGRGFSTTPWRDHLPSVTYVDLRGIHSTGVALDDRRFLDMIAARATGLGVDLIVLDPITRMLSREIDVNGQGGASRIHAAADWLTKTTGATILMTNHVSKAGMSRAPGEDRGAAASSGNHLLTDLSRMVLRVVPLSKQEAKKAYGLEDPALELTVPKANFSRPLDEPVILSRQRGGALRHEVVESKAVRIEEQVLEVLQQHPNGLDRDEWQAATAEEVGIGRTLWERAKAALVGSGRVEVRPVQRVAGKVGKQVFFPAGSAPEA
jgi:RecA-family ATPase